MKDKQILKIICDQTESLISSCEGMVKEEFLKNENVRASVLREIQKIGKLGMKISPNMTRGYSKHFFWGLFFFMENWDDVEDDHETLWHLLNGHTYKKVKYESLKDHLVDLKMILYAALLKTDVGPSQRIKLLKQRIKNDNQQIEHSKQFNYKSKMNDSSGRIILLYTPMGNKR